MTFPGLPCTTSPVRAWHELGWTFEANTLISWTALDNTPRGGHGLCWAQCNMSFLRNTVGRSPVSHLGHWHHQLRSTTNALTMTWHNKNFNPRLLTFANQVKGFSWLESKVSEEIKLFFFMKEVLTERIYLKYTNSFGRKQSSFMYNSHKVQTAQMSIKRSMEPNWIDCAVEHRPMN